MSPYLLIVVAVAVWLIPAIVLSTRAAKRRRLLFAKFAQGNGWTWTDRDDSWTRRWDGAPFGQGDHRRATNVVCGLRGGRPIVAFDYSYQTHKGDRATTTHRYGICAMGMPVDLPRLQVTRENVLTRVGGALARDDIEFESVEFNRTFRVTCSDRKFAFDVLNPRQLAMLLENATVPWRLDGAYLLCWNGGRHSPTEVLERLRLFDRILDGIPSFVWRDRGVTPKRSGEPST